MDGLKRKYVFSRLKRLDFQGQGVWGPCFLSLGKILPPLILASVLCRGVIWSLCVLPIFPLRVCPNFSLFIRTPAILD